MPNVKLVNLKKTFEKGRIIAVDHVDLHINEKEYLTLLGPSGCGKTTTLRMIAGLVEPDEGEIYIDDELVTGVPPEDRDIGYVFQQYALFPHMDVWDNVTYGPRVKGWEPEESERIGREMLEMVRLFERLDASPSDLSGGMMQRVALARALAAGAKLLLLDEPLGALDAKIRFELRYELRKLVKDLGLTAIHVTHDQGEAMAISDRIALMKKGRILQVGTPEELYMHPKHVFVANFIGESNFLEGYVSRVNEKESVIELRGGILVRTLDRTKKRGEKVVVAVRPEVLSVEKEEERREKGEEEEEEEEEDEEEEKEEEEEEWEEEEGRRRKVNVIFGQVERLRFEGTNIRYEIRLENEDLVVVVRPALIGEWLDVGERVTVSFPVEKSFVFAYPERGLREELALE